MRIRCEVDHVWVHIDQKLRVVTVLNGTQGDSTRFELAEGVQVGQAMLVAVAWVAVALIDSAASMSVGKEMLHAVTQGDCAQLHQVEKKMLTAEASGDFLARHAEIDVLEETLTTVAFVADAFVAFVADAFVA